MKEKRFIDDIEEINLEMWEIEAYHEAVQDMVDGSTLGPLRAAELIRDHALATNRPRVRAAKLKDIADALLVVLRRYGLHRPQRGFGFE